MQAPPVPADPAGVGAEVAAGWERLAAGDAQAALELCGRLIVAHGDRAAVLALAAAAARGLGRPDAGGKLDARAAMMALNQGHRHSAAQDFRTALAAYRWGAALCPEQSFYHHFTGETLLALNRIAEAAAAFRHALRLRHDDIPAAFRLADTLVLLGLWRATDAAARRCVELAPDHHIPHSLESLSAHALGWHARALAALDRAARLAPERPPFTLHRGHVLRELGDVTGALAAFRAAAAGDPNRTEAYFNAALCMAALGRSPAALPENGACAEARLAEGRAAEAAGDWRTAANRYAAALAARPDLPGPADAQRRLLAAWRDALRDGTRPLAERNPDWVICESYRADVEYRTRLVAEPRWSGIPGTVPARPAGSGRRRVWDGCMVSTELDMLELRLTELDGVVDRFIVVESPWTHQGRPKELLFHNNRARFAAFADRIVHVVADERREGVPWEQETYQRACILTGLGPAGPDGAADDDLLSVGDVDEIPRRDVIARIAADDRLAARVNGLSVTNYNYFINFESHQPFVRPVVLPCGLARAIGANLARHLLIRSGNHIVPVIPDAGWHFSWLGGTEAVWRKLQNFCHLELLESMPSREEIAVMLAAGDFRITSQVLEGRFVPIGPGFPEAVRRDTGRLGRLGWVWPPDPAQPTA